MRVSHKDIKPFIEKDSKVLILGSFPSVKSREKGFYYAHRTNRFFKVLSSIFDEEEPITIDERKKFLTKHKIALYDVIEECEIEGSMDSSIKEEKPSDVKKLLEEGQIRMIFTTGNKASELFRKYNPSLQYVPLPSTSAANAQMSLKRLVEIYRRDLIPYIN